MADTRSISDPRIDALRPWYHDFSKLGIDTGQAPPSSTATLAARLIQLCAQATKGRLRRRLTRRGSLLRTSSHRLNQSRKESVLWPLLETTLASAGAEPLCLDLFCADGYYSCAISKINPHARVVGVDLDNDNLERARLASELLGIGHIEFLRADVRTFIGDTADKFDLVFCAGGLYHLSDPRALLADLRRICTRFLLLQTVVSLENEASAYFKSPAPGWSHGCRFSHARLAGWLEELGWHTETASRNELPGNRRARDRGSSYFLCLAPELGAGSKP